jgi:hypothetical protein
MSPSASKGCKARFAIGEEMRASASALAIGGLISAITVGPAGQSTASRAVVQDRGTRARALIDGFDDCIQQRFTDVDEGFGFRRIVKPGDTPHRFKPENVREEGAVRGLEGAGLRVVLYLTGRRVLAADGGGAGMLLESPLIKGPVEVTRAQREGDLRSPSPLDLRGESRRAMIAFERTSSYDFTAGGWTFVARPVRASDASCLRCHEADGSTHTFPSSDRVTALRVGDALGALLYGYQSAR